MVGNIKFTPGKEVDSSKVEDLDVLEDVCELLGCESSLLEKYMITKKITAGNEQLTVPLTPENASSAKDSLAMLLYSRLFDW